MSRTYTLRLKYRDGTIGTLRTQKPETIAEWRDRLRELRGRLRIENDEETIVLDSEDVVAYEVLEE